MPQKLHGCDQDDDPGCGVKGQRAGKKLTLSLMATAHRGYPLTLLLQRQIRLIGDKLSVVAKNHCDIFSTSDACVKICWRR